MKRSTLSVVIGAALLLVGSTAVLAAGRSGAEQGATATSALFTPASVALVPPTCDNSPDGAACSANSDCSSKKCEGGSCCTKHDDPCDSSSHCCGHQSCGTDGKCP
jgi:Ca2+/H+ antiporter